MAAVDSFDKSYNRPITRGKTFRISDTSFGYRIHQKDQTPRVIVIAQTICWGMAIVTLLASVGLWIMPGASSSPDLIGMKLGASVVLMAIGLLMLWFASRGYTSAIDVDTYTQEVRETIRTHGGEVSVISRYDFAQIGSVYIQRPKRKGEKPQLVLRYLDTTQVIPVVEGQIDELEALRDRLGRDIIQPKGF